MGGGKFAPTEKKREGTKLIEGKEGTEPSDDPDYIPPPDGGWGWMVVFSSFLIHVVADGVVYSFGVFLMEFVDYFQAGRGAASWIGSLQPAVTFTVGPLSSALTNRYGCRPVTIAGAIIAGAGFILSAWAPNLYYLYFTAGIMAGVGFGLIYLPAIVCVAQYFEKRRSFATGLAVCGSGFGTFILAPVTEILVHEYQWSGAMLILGGIILNVIACGIIFRPLEAPFPETGKNLPGSESEALIPDISDSLNDTTKNSVAVEEIELIVDKNFSTAQQAGDGEFKEKDGQLSADEGLQLIANLQKKNALPSGTPKFINNTKTNQAKEHSLSLSLPNKNALNNSLARNISTNNTKDEPVSDSESQPETTSTDVTSSLNTSQPTDSSKVKIYTEVNGVSKNRGTKEGNNIVYLSVSQCITGNSDFADNPAAMACSDSALNRQLPSHDSEGTAVKRRSKRLSESSTSSHLAPLSRKDIFYSGSLQNIPMYRSHPDVYKTTVTSTSEKQETELDSSKEKGGFAVLSEFRRTMKDMLSLSLLKNPVFLMFAVSNFFTSIGFNMPFIFLPDRAKLAGIDADKAALLLSVIGIANTAGRVIFGFLSDRPWVNRLFLYNTALTICGAATALSPVLGGTYGLLVAYAAVFGVFIGVYVSLTSVVLVDLLGLDFLTNSFGLLLLFQGAATFIGPPIAGWLCDWTGSYDISFIVMGILIALSGCMLYLLPLVQRHCENKITKDRLAHDVEMGKHPVTDKETMIGIEMTSNSES
ncbi:monocarboxylate transporter 12-B-like [Physella acuta]|uniref:monocarboxylate transporter 12-B-like n=1 Tax=Physella acuta TaxID=109671 RepID=UPI0027DE301A|nr:monocarboxylate transporter 12-B-like [Physella acuta]XP_059175114.1 monocarboxylate transporter 12-B-like [Physella acuta]XP_059175115.1 monocarboxylate transporter 12-B-like [Physella acuta]